MTHDSCRLLEARIAEVLDESLTGDGLAGLRAHGTACERCAEVLRVHGELAAALRGLPAPPALEVPVPAIPAGRVLPFRRRIAAGLAAGIAAALLAAAALGPFGGPFGAGDAPAPIVEGRAVTVQQFVDFSVSSTVPDEGLLALTAGWDAVAALRPTEVR